jgi:hypothetical protein
VPAFLAHLAAVVGRPHLIGVLLLSMLWLASTAGATFAREPDIGCAAVDATPIASIAEPAPSSSVEPSTFGAPASIEAPDAQDEPAPALSPASSTPRGRKQVRPAPAVAFTSIPASRSERPPIRSFLQS